MMRLVKQQAMMLVAVCLEGDDDNREMLGWLAETFLSLVFEIKLKPPA
jgi:hypothetical protein